MAGHALEQAALRFDARLWSVCEDPPRVVEHLLGVLTRRTVRTLRCAVELVADPEEEGASA